MALESGSVPGRHDSIPPLYRAHILDRTGLTLVALSITAPTDDVAATIVRSIVDGHGIDLWEGLRFIEHFPPVDKPK